MKKVFQIMKREAIFQVIFVFFVFITLITSLAVLLGPLEVSDSKVVKILNSSELLMWSFILVPSVIISLLIGACMTFWKMKWPTREEDIFF
jgi:ABC-type enterobactin transport system permease subunit